MSGQLVRGWGSSLTDPHVVGVGRRDSVMLMASAHCRNHFPRAPWLKHMLRLHTGGVVGVTARLSLGTERACPD